MEVPLETLLENRARDIANSYGGWLPLGEVLKILGEADALYRAVPLHLPDHIHSPACLPFTDEKNLRPGCCLAGFELH
jgi:hypothetical protein